MPTVHLIIQGKVQGVFYRATAKKKADEFGLTGWVQNMPDNSVEIMASGAQPALDKFMEWCKEGPSRAKVTHVIKTEQEEEIFSRFEVRR